jgi:hypothetical protein
MPSLVDERLRTVRPGSSEGPPALAAAAKPAGRPRAGPVQPPPPPAPPAPPPTPPPPAPPATPPPSLPPPTLVPVPPPLPPAPLPLPAPPVGEVEEAPARTNAVTAPGDTTGGSFGEPPASAGVVSLPGGDTCTGMLPTTNAHKGRGRTNRQVTEGCPWCIARGPRRSFRTPRSRAKSIAAWGPPPWIAHSMKNTACTQGGQCPLCPRSCNSYPQPRLKDQPRWTKKQRDLGRDRDAEHHGSTRAHVRCAALHRVQNRCVHPPHG